MYANWGKLTRYITTWILPHVKGKITRVDFELQIQALGNADSNMSVYMCRLTERGNFSLHDRYKCWEIQIYRGSQMQKLEDAAPPTLWSKMEKNRDKIAI